MSESVKMCYSYESFGDSRKLETFTEAGKNVKSVTMPIIYLIFAYYLFLNFLRRLHLLLKD